MNLITFWQGHQTVITHSTAAGRFAITDTNLDVPVVTLSTQDNAKLMQQLKTSFKKTTNKNKYHSKLEPYTRKPHLDCVIDRSF